jgi:hypothetical protein
MAKKNQAAKTAAADTSTTADLPTGEAQTVGTEDVGAAPAAVTGAEAPAATKVPVAKMRGPRGVAETAIVRVLVDHNPKRPGSKAHMVFSQYVDGMTVGAFCDAVDKSVNSDGTSNVGAGTPNLVYDAAHGFISIEGYTVPGGVIVAKPKAPPKPKAEKKEKAAKPTKAENVAAAEQSAETVAANTAAVEEATTEETVE